MSEKKTILVTGATGAQGGSVVKFLLQEGSYNVRGLTRHLSSDKAQALQKSGVKMVEGDLGDINSLRAAIHGSDGVFGVTNFWEHFDKEYAQGKNLIDAVAAEKVRHFVFSSLPHAKEISGGKLPAPHLDNKAELEEYTRTLGIPSTFVHVASYYENFLSFFPPQHGDNGSYSFGFPQGDTPLASVAVEDIGGVIAQIFNHPDKFVGKVIGIVGDDLKPADYAQQMSKRLGKKIVYNYIPRDVFASFGFPGADDLANMFEFNRLYIHNRTADLENSRKLYPDIRTFDQWLADNKDKLDAVLK